VSLGAQVLGTAAGVLWALVAGAVLYGVLRRTMGLRLTAEEEFDGADLSIHRIGSTPEREASW
jgi:ammonium transporter, Amt family